MLAEMYLPLKTFKLFPTKLLAHVMGEVPLKCGTFDPPLASGIFLLANLF